MNANELANELEIVKNKLIGKEHELCKRAIIFYTEAATMLRQQQAEIEELRKFKAEIDAENKKLFEAVQKANAMWDRATGVKNEQ